MKYIKMKGEEASGQRVREDIFIFIFIFLFFFRSTKIGS